MRVCVWHSQRRKEELCERYYLSRPCHGKRVAHTLTYESMYAPPAMVFEHEPQFQMPVHRRLMAVLPQKRQL